MDSPKQGVPALDKSRKALEDSFFVQQDQKLIENLRRMKAMKETKEELAKVSGIANDAVLQKLVDLEVRPETLASLTVVPLVEVAWADGEIDDKERTAVLAAVSASGMDKNSIDYQLVQEWLSRKPQPQMLEAWMHYIQGLCEVLNPTETKAIKDAFLGHARSVAEASGGMLGLGIGNRTSKSEAAMLTKLETAFRNC